MKATMKKSLLFLITFCLFVVLSGFNSEHTKVYDEAELLSAAEEQKLQDEAVRIAQTHQLDIGIATTRDTNGASSARYANDFYDSHDFGYDAEGTGILLLIDMDNRNVYITTTGNVIDVFSFKITDGINAKVGPQLTSKCYYDACMTFLAEVDAFMPHAQRYRPLNIPSGLSLDGILHRQPYYLLAAAAAGIIVLVILFSGQRSKMTAGKLDYLAGRKYDLKQRQDHFTHTTTTSRVIPKDDDHSGSGHSSSGGGGGGRSHGGSGRSF